MRPARVLIGFILLYQIACSTYNNPYEVVIQVASDERRITIAVSGNPNTGYKIEEPVPSARVVASGTKLHWTIMNNTDDVKIRQVTIDQFRSDGDTSVCVNGVESFPLAETINAGTEKSFKTNCTVKHLATFPKSYKYRISVVLDSGASVPPLDPMIVITR